MCEQQNVDFKNVRKLMMQGYERNINLPSAGFSAGPCLLKDTMQLRTFYKGNFELGMAAMKINQNNLIELILSKIKNIKNYRRITIGLMELHLKLKQMTPETISNSNS